MISLIITYKYWFIFIGTLIGGELVIIPVIYLSTIGGLDLLIVGSLIVLATFLSDSFWYWVGRNIPKERWINWPIIRRKQNVLERFSNFFENYGIKLVFASKFMFGTRTVSQIISGSYNLPFWKYISSSLSGMLSWFLILAALAAGLELGLNSLKETAVSLQISITAFIVLVVAMHLGFKHLFKRYTSE